MKVKELIEMLQEYEPESDIAVYDGDYEQLNFTFHIDDVYTSGVVEGCTKYFEYVETGSYSTRVLGVFQ